MLKKHLTWIMVLTCAVFASAAMASDKSYPEDMPKKELRKLEAACAQKDVKACKEAGKVMRAKYWYLRNKLSKKQRQDYVQRTFTTMKNSCEAERSRVCCGVAQTMSKGRLSIASSTRALNTESTLPKSYYNDRCRQARHDEDNKIVTVETTHKMTANATAAGSATCKFKKSVYSQWSNASSISNPNTGFDKSQAASDRQNAIAIMYWQDKGIRSPDNPKGHYLTWSGISDDIVGCYLTPETSCGLAKDYNVRDKFTALRNRNGWAGNEVPVYPPQEALTWARQKLGCTQNSAPIDLYPLIRANRDNKDSAKDKWTALAVKSEAKCMSGDKTACKTATDQYLKGRYNGQVRLRLAVKGCELGDGDMCHFVGDAYSHPRAVVKVNPVRGYPYLKKSCDLSSAKGCFGAGVSQRDGVGITASLDQAANFFAKSCKLGHKKACKEQSVAQYNINKRNQARQAVIRQQNAPPVSFGNPNGHDDMTVRRANDPNGYLRETGPVCRPRKIIQNGRMFTKTECLDREMAIKRGWVKR